MPNLMLSPGEREELEARVRSRVLRAEDARKARLLLMLADDLPYRSIQQALGCSSAYISRWKVRFETDRLSGLYGRHPGRRVTALTPRVEARILEKTRKAPSDGSTHWSSRRLATVLGVSHMLVARAWARAGLKPHRVARYMASDDPEFEAKAADIIGLYVTAPACRSVLRGREDCYPGP